MNFRLFIFSIFNIWFCVQCYAQTNYRSEKWINSFLERHPEFSRVNISVDGECQWDKFHINRIKPKDHYNTVYKDSLCNFYASGGKFEIGIQVDSFPNLYLHQKLSLKDSTQINLDLSYEELTKGINLNKLLLDQNLDNGSIEWIQISNNRWYSVCDTLKIYKEDGVIKINWASRKNGSASKTDKIVKELSNGNFERLRNIEKRFVYPREKSKAPGSHSNCGENYSYHIIAFNNIKKFYIETSCKNEYWKELRNKILIHTTYND